MDFSHVTIHIGMNKCASTTLQECFFPRLENHVYIGNRQGDDQEQAKHPHFAYLTKVASTEEAEYEEYREFIAKKLRDVASTAERLVISFEEFGAGHHLHPIAATDRTLMARRLAEIFPGAHILLVIRNQLTYLPSCFFQRVRAMGSIHYHHRFSDYVEFERMLQKTRPELLFAIPRYDRIYRIYADLFPPENIHVLLLEDLKNAPDTFMNGLAKSLRIPLQDIENTFKVSALNTRASRGERYLGLLSKWLPGGVRKVFPKALKQPIIRFLRSLSPPEARLTDEQIRYLRDKYREGNRFLAEVLSLSLEKYDYPL